MTHVAPLDMNSERPRKPVSSGRGTPSAQAQPHATFDRLRANPCIPKDNGVCGDAVTEGYVSIGSLLLRHSGPHRKTNTPLSNCQRSHPDHADTERKPRDMAGADPRRWRRGKTYDGQVCVRLRIIVFSCAVTHVAAQSRVFMCIPASARVGCNSWS